MNLSPNLTLAEFTRSSTATAKKIDNSLPDELLPHAILYATKCFQSVREIWGNLPRALNSGYRCRALNTVVGGGATSQHMFANAGDYGMRPGENIFTNFLKLLESDGFVFDQLLIEGAKFNNPQSGWIHVSYNTLNQRANLQSGLNPKAMQRGEIKIVTFPNGKAVYKAVDRATAIEWASARI